MMDSDLREILAACLGQDTPDPERERVLLNRLENDAAFRLAVVDELRMLGMIRIVQTGEPKWLRLADAVGGSAARTVDDGDMADAVVKRAASRARRRQRTRLVVTVAGIAAVVLFAVLYIRSRPAGRDELPPPRDEVARIAEVDGEVWTAAGRTAFSVGDPVSEGRIQIRSGRLTLAYASGVTFCAEGPAEFDLVSRSLVRFRSGNMRVRVPSGAEGFTVRADGFEVVDLGTEFGMKAVPGGKTQLMVFEGEAAVSVFGDGGRSVKSAIVETAQAVEIDAESRTIREGLATADAFVRPPARVTADEPPLELDPTYRNAVLAAKPWSYWRFDRRTRRTVLNELPGRPRLNLVGRVSLDGPPDRNRHVLFDSGDTNQALVMDDDWTPPRATGYAIEFWVMPTADRPPIYGKSALVSLIAERQEPNEHHASLIELTAQSRELAGPSAVRLLDRWPAGLSGGVNAVSRRLFEAGKWHHVVGQKRADTVELFIDGELVASSPVPPPTDPAAATSGACRLLIGRLKFKGIDLDNVRPFVGRLDELAIYDHVLSPEVIRAHFGLRR